MPESATRLPSGSSKTCSSTDPVVKIRESLVKVLSDEKVFKYSAKTSFQQFDQDHNNLLDFEETKAFFERLRHNLTIPPISEATLRAIFEKYDRKGRDGLSLNDFTRMYKALLLRIRDRYYPPPMENIRSTLFVPMVPLGKSQELRQYIKFEKRLGSGSFGEVYRVTDRRVNAERACKLINKGRVQVPLEQIQEEIQILKSVDHPNVIKIYEIFEDPSSVYILQELCQGGELLSTMLIDEGKAKIHDEFFVRRIMQELLDGLSHIHSKRIMHKDLKPENILFANKNPNSPIKIIDFGLGEIFRGHTEVTDVLRGSAIYMAPEAFQDGQLCLKSDVWSAGCIMFNLLTGKFPFDAEDLSQFREVVVKAELDLNKSCSHVSEEARSLLRTIFKKDPRERCSASGALKHPWFKANTNLSTINLSESICRNMKNYSKRNGLHNVFVNMMAQQLSINNNKVSKIAEIFKELDKNKTGTLTLPDLQSALMRAGFEEWDANRIIQQLDLRGEGRISYTEFLAACYSWRESELNLVWAAFQRFVAQDGSQRIRCEDMRNLLLRSTKPKPAVTQSPHFGRESDSVTQSVLFDGTDEADIDAMIKEVDLDGDGYIDWTDFEQYIRGSTTAILEDRATAGYSIVL
eukprot:Blabericola_migrator_1__4935@NODE_2574_length_2585_cov_336_116362_g1612_i0_p1_GENE_NODE_2574_length_2585_cov_336_116362_g1612_i0NODE_2574_length_2585_cov_336_116362_g1612_i0_p1_ORF_typecomplete_len634_score132_34Pkinase/PF00069_25/3_7e67Pkinase_Tyr/PF07714_17/1_1e44EFhand_7/PF13499_6/1_7e07EFhand_7/PF13499_6/3_9e11EFhand_7/PF13499_6/6_2e08EFhand_8/PF13833_6/0_027EFhand_8/PF13833_6/0_75EFhand_8/PF13833_6/0_14EFhand_8/PF13833_6/0_0086EFhand_8/PF13833_6/4_3e06EFhand_1/PF00036_32/0_29EFhand_1/PF0003